MLSKYLHSSTLINLEIFPESKNILEIKDEYSKYLEYLFDFRYNKIEYNPIVENIKDYMIYQYFNDLDTKYYHSSIYDINEINKIIITHTSSLMDIYIKNFNYPLDIAINPTKKMIYITNSNIQKLIIYLDQMIEMNNSIIDNLIIINDLNYIPNVIYDKSYIKNIKYITI